jgi:hypothetical protein
MTNGLYGAIGSLNGALAISNNVGSHQRLLNPVAIARRSISFYGITLKVDISIRSTQAHLGG